ncbi:putative Maltase 2 [Hypsibius exemplaris]|uniref:Maltase 2 n=1 Tax=Hypsibius exemplaris TaxID=2072580 RepID=A0A1W0WXG1_HYPEX|nr:putative Maltase 2 [Hypsibius exemplaris]
MDDAMRFWLDLGVDGFRIDALPFLFEVPHDEMVDKNETSPSPYWPEANLNTNDYEYWLHPYTRNVDPIFEVIKNWTRIMDDYSSKSEKKEPKLLILEVVDKNSSQLVKYYPEDPFGTGAMPFYMGLIFMTDQTDGFAVQKLVEENLDMLPKGAWPNWVIGNHDQRRATGRLGNKDFVDGLNILNLLLPGIPTTYYGEEIGMRDTLINSREEVKDPQGCNFGDEWAKKTRDYCRSPMQWDSHNTSAGFSTNVTTWLPLAPDWNNTINVEYQTSKSSNQTHYSVFKRLIQIRGTPAFQSGTFRHALVTRDIYSFVRESGEQSYLIALDMRRNSSGDPSKDRVKYDFTGGAAKLTGKGRVVTASVNLYPKGGAPAPENSIASYGTTEEINLTSVELIPASAVVLRITPA